MTNPDRLTGLDASFLALEDAGAHMHVGSCLLFEGEAPDYDDFVAQLDSRLHLVPRYRQKLAFPPLDAGAAGVGRRPALQPRLPRAPHRAAGAREPRAAAQPGRARARPAPRPHEAAVGDLARRRGRGRALRDDHQDPPLPRRRRLGRRHRDRAVRPRARSPRRRRSRRRPWFPRPAAELGDADRRRAGRARRARRSTPRASRRRARRTPRRAAGQVGKAAAGLGAMLARRAAGRAAEPATTCRSARTGASRGPTATSRSSRRSRTALGGTVNDVVLTRGRGRAAHPHAGQRARGRRRRAEGDGARCRCAPRPSAARSATA